MSIDIAELLAPISADRPCGEDVSFDDVFDRVREARRADDPALRQGEWQTEIKQADWREVIKLASEVLAHRSKDLQMCVWLGEALIARDGLDGAAQAFELLQGLLQAHWACMCPQLEGDDVEERAAKLAWFNIYASDALRRVPLAHGAKPVTLLDWQDSREVDNLSRQNNQEAYQAALEEGRMPGELFDKALLDNPAAGILQLLTDADHALAAFAPFKHEVDARLGRAAPSLAAVEDALKRLRQVIAKAAQDKGIGTGEATPPAADEVAAGAPRGPLAAHASGGMALDLSANTAASKQAALRTLADIAGFFRRTEPHSPVAFMLDKAVAWADTPLDTWLAEVVRDETVLATIRSRVGIPEP